MQEQKPSVQKRPLYCNVREDLVQIVKNNGFSPEKAGADFNPLIDACIKAFNIKERKMGIIVTGAYGCGKTCFVKSLKMASKFIDLTIAETVEWLDARGGYASSMNDMMQGNIVLDDLGAESLVNDYGVKRDIVGEFICRYHSLGKGRMFITTNLRGNELLDRYGGRVVDRLKQLCVPVRMNGESKREWL